MKNDGADSLRNGAAALAPLGAGRQNGRHNSSEPSAVSNAHYFSLFTTVGRESRKRAIRYQVKWRVKRSDRQRLIESFNRLPDNCGLITS